MRHRIFIAVNLPQNVKTELVKYQDGIEEMFNAVAGGEFARRGVTNWVKPENLHITLVFIGYVESSRILEICHVAKDAAAINPAFEIKINKIAYGPPKAMPPRMIWAISEKTEKFAVLKEGLEKRLLALPGLTLSPEEREFSPHITMGRVQQWRWKHIDPEERPQIEQDINLKFPVPFIEVMESKLKPGGAEYAVLGSYKLGE